MKILYAYCLLLSGMYLSCQSTYDVSVKQTAHYDPGTTGLVSSDSSMIEIISPYQHELNTIMDETLVQSESVLERGKPESKLGNLVSDMCYENAVQLYQDTIDGQIDFCVLNYGGLRSSLPSGNVTRENVFELMPFENELVVLTLKGASVSKILTYISFAGGVPVSHLRMKIADSTFTDVTISGKPFDSLRTYKVVTSDYLADGGDNMTMLKENISKASLNMKVRDAIINSMIAVKNKNEKLNPVLDDRITK